VVREGEEVPKKGWFSGRKSQAPNSPASTSYPPSVTSVGETQKSERRSITDDGELPPREANASEASTSALPTQGTGHQPGDVADDIPPELPSHAGFDLAAMRAAIDDIQGGVQNQRDASGVVRLEFAPASPFPPQGTAAAQPRSIPPSGSGSGSPELPSARTLSVGDMCDAGPFGSEDANEEYEDGDDASRTPSPPTVSPHSRATAGPTLSFKGQDETSWAPEVPDKDIFGDFGAAPIGNPFRSTPFAAVGSTVAPSSNTSTGIDISNASLGTERDPWSFQTFPADVPANNTSVKKSPSMFSVNPWER
jgi:hypothetical protein